MEEYISIVSALTALFAVVVGPLITLYVARREIHAATVSTSRQHWINTLRDELSNFLSAFAVACAQSATLNKSDEASLESIRTLTMLVSKISLLLNPKETDHRELINLLEEAHRSAWVSEPQKLPSILTDMQRRVIEKSQAILKREWDRVKTFE